MQKIFPKVPAVSNNSRLFAILMAFSGGAIDVYCHNYFHGLVATQTGNIILMASNPIYHHVHSRFFIRDSS